MKKPLAALLAVALTGAAFVGPAHAKKKPKPRRPVRADQTYYPVYAGTDCAAETMQLKLDPGGGTTSCGSPYMGPVHTLCDDTPAAAVLDCSDIAFEASEGLPLTLDASKPIAGTILARSFYAGDAPVGASAGPTTLHVGVHGTVDGEVKVLGASSAGYTVTPDKSTYEVPFEIDVPADLDKATLTTFGIDLWNTGPAPLHGFYQATGSKVVVPVWTVPVGVPHPAPAAPGGTGR